MRLTGFGKHRVPVLIFAALLSAGTAGSWAQSARHEPIAAHPREVTSNKWTPDALGTPLLRDPIFVYNNWSAYDELSDNVLLTEQLAMKELDEILRLRSLGVRIDYYVMDAFWFAADGGYRKWRTSSWPNGPDEWIRKCRENGILPGLWFGTNNLVKIEAAPAWQDSLNDQHTVMSFHEGGFLPDLMDTLQLWYDRGVRMFKFDFVDFGAVTAETEARLSKDEIRARNSEAFREALRRFRQKNPEAVLVAYNGFGGDLESTSGPFPFQNPVDLRWLEVFDSLYPGDPRPSDVPQVNFWRSVDIYSDHQVRRYEQSHVPLERIDSSSFMMGNTGTIYYRKTNAWKGMAVLMLARGGWVNTIYGSLELLSDNDARWLAKVQSLYLRLQAMGRTKTFGGIPGELEPYGFGSVEAEGALYAVVNPSQSVQEIRMPPLTRQQQSNRSGRVLFRDAGFMPLLEEDRIKLGPGQLALVGYGRYAQAQYDLGIQDDVQIPRAITPVSASPEPAGNRTWRAVLTPPAKGDIRIIVQQRDARGNVMRSWGGGPPNGTNVARILSMRASQNGRAVPIEISCDKVIWSGLSWAAGEIKRSALQPGVPLTVECSSTEGKSIVLEGKAFAVEY
jgi:hypothetical protein